MEATATPAIETPAAPVETVAAPVTPPAEVAVEVVAASEAKPATEVAAPVDEKPAETVAAPVVQVEMVAASAMKEVSDKLVAESAAKEAAVKEIEALKAQVTNISLSKSDELAKKDAELASLSGKVASTDALVLEYKAALSAAIPQDKLSEAVLKAASGIVEGYDAAKTVADQSPQTIMKLLKFSETIAQSTNAGAVETVKRKKPAPNFVFEGITIKPKAK
jgi:hypothetical protein